MARLVSSSSPFSTVPLRVDPRSPGLSDALPAGAAGRKWLGADAGLPVHSRSSSGCSLWLCVEFRLDAASRSRLPGSFGRIWRVLCFFFLDALLRWQEPWLGRERELGISVNKTAFPFSWRLVVLVLSRGARRSSVMLSVKPTWWRFDEAGRSGEAFFNKRAGVLLLLQSELDVALFLLAGRGGEGEEKLGVGCCSVRRRGRLDVLLRSSEAVRLRSSSMMAASAAMILGQQRPLRAVMCSRHRGLLFLQAKEEPRWRIFDPSATSHTDGDPSGMFPGVAGGGCCSGSCSGREEGLDCFPNFYFQVLLVKFEDSFANPVWIRVLFVIVPAN